MFWAGECKMAAVLTCYLDESAVDGGSAVSAVGGLVLNNKGCYWLGEEWRKAVAKHSLGKGFVHMKDFGADDDLRKVSVESRGRLFCDLAKIINDNKAFSIEGTLTPDQYRRHFGFLSSEENLSIHAMCFFVAATTQGKWADEVGYRDDIPFVLDDGCTDQRDVEGAHHFLVNVFQPSNPVHAGGLDHFHSIHRP